MMSGLAFYDPYKMSVVEFLNSAMILTSLYAGRRDWGIALYWNHVVTSVILSIFAGV